MSEHSGKVMVDRPLSSVYNQWTQFADFPQFMEGVKSVEQVDDSTTKWNVEVGGVEREFVADIVDQTPDQSIHWKSRTEPFHEGRVMFRADGKDATEVNLWMMFDPQGIVETVGDKLGFVGRRVQGDLERFKAFSESHDHETGAWRDKIRHGETTSADTTAAETKPLGSIDISTPKSQDTAGAPIKIDTQVERDGGLLR